MSEIRYFHMTKKQQNDKVRRKLCDNKRKIIYLVYNVFKAWRMQKSKRDVTVGIVLISPHICCLLNTEEGKNNLCALIKLNLQEIRKIKK